jgi:dethiobiotin synthetase
MSKIIFITGTDTGVGKTVLTGLLLHYLRESGCRALAMKPFCSGGREDVRLLQSLQPGQLPDEEMNPFYFQQPLAPLIAARKEGRVIRLEEVLQKIRKVQAKCDCLLIEGAGGVLVPLGKDLTITDVIRTLKCEAIVVARNRLGVINHTMLTIKALHSAKIRCNAVVLMSEKNPDYASRTNEAALVELLQPIRIVAVPYLQNKPVQLGTEKKNNKKMKKTLAMLSEMSKLSPVLLKISK